MIVAISASGRKNSNSHALLENAAKGAEGEVKHYRLADLNFKGCTGCGACRNGSDKCVIKDDLTEVLDAIVEADALILATPNYYGYTSGIFKSFLDRWYSFKDGERNSRIPEGKELLFIHTQGHPDPKGYAPMLASMEKIFSAYGFAPKILVGAGLEAQGSALFNEELMAKAFESGKSLA